VKVLIDVSLSPTWGPYLISAGFDAVHWSEIGDLREKDSVLMDWARQRGCVVFTHDLDFSALLATTGALGPSVLQVRTQDVLPDAIGPAVVRAFREYSEVLEKGAIISLDELASRVRILPIRQGT
jgi:predicted nuclease of predicted toxin-antitoxin system